MSTLLPDSHAVVIGVGADLPSTIRDAEGLAAILTDKERCAYPARQVHLLTSKKATRDRILTVLDELSRSVGSESSVVVYFSGHGYRVTQAGATSYYLMPYEYNTVKLEETAISGAEFTDRLHALRAKKLLLLLDCCHAGGVGVAKSPQGEVVGPPPASEVSKAVMPEEARTLLARGGGRVIIASSMETEVSYAGEPYSAFTAALIEALCGRGVAVKDGYVRVSDLVRYTAEVVPGRTQGKQHPIVHFEQADNFKVAYYAGGEQKPKAPPFEDLKIEPHPGDWNPHPEISWNIDYTAGDSLQAGGDIYHANGDINIARGNIYKASGDIRVSVADHARVSPVEEIFAELKGRVASLPQRDQSLVKLLLDETHTYAVRIQEGDFTNDAREALEKRLRSLLNEAHAIGEEALRRLATPSPVVAASIQEIAGRLKQGR